MGKSTINREENPLSMHIPGKNKNNVGFLMGKSTIKCMNCGKSTI